MSSNDKKTRLALTLEEKAEIFNHREKNPKVSFEAIGHIFTEKWGKKINKMTAIRSYQIIKTQKENGLEIDGSDKTRLRIRPKKILQFEKELFQTINNKLLQTPMTRDAKARTTFYTTINFLENSPICFIFQTP